MLEISRPNIPSDYLVDYGEDAFFKLDIEKLLELEEITPNRPQYAFLNAVNNPDYRFVTACLSRRVGKTFIANMMAMLVWMVPGCNVLLIAPDYSLASISWEFQQGMMKKYGIEVEKNNSKDRLIHFSNGSLIKVASVNKADSAVGRSYDFILFDESAISHEAAEKFEVALRPTLDKKGATAVFISTPRGSNWFKTYFDRGFSDEFPAWCSIHADYKENDRMLESDVEEARRSMSRAKFEQEYLACFTTFEGQIYEAFSRSDHVISELPSGISALEGLGGMDVGFRDATALCCVKFDYSEECFYIVDEYVDSSKNTKEYAKEMSALANKWEMDLIYCDSAAAQFRHDLATLYDLSTVKPDKDILGGYDFINALLVSGKLKIHSSCRKTIEGFINYRWDINAQKEKAVHDEHSHIMDAVRYVLYTFGRANISLEV